MDEDDDFLIEENEGNDNEVKKEKTKDEREQKKT